MTTDAICGPITECELDIPTAKKVWTNSLMWPLWFWSSSPRACVMKNCLFPHYSYCVKTYMGHREWVRQVRVSPDGESPCWLLWSWLLPPQHTHILPLITGSLLASCSNDQVGRASLVYIEFQVMSYCMPVLRPRTVELSDFMLSLLLSIYIHVTGLI